jgi:hypothetical protein
VANPSRIFPLVSERIFSGDAEVTGLTTEQGVARVILNSARQKPGVWEHFRPSRLSFLRQIGLFLAVFRSAFEAELAGQWRRSDFYWSEFKRTFEALQNKTQLWNAAVGEAALSLGVETAKPATEFQSALVREVFCEIHGACHAAIVREATSPIERVRADFHLKSMLWLLPYASCGSEEKARLLSTIKNSAQEYLKVKDWTNALALAEILVAQDPLNIDYQELLVYVTHSTTMERVSTLKDEAAASEIERGIARLDAVRARFPNHSAVFEALGSEHYLRAIKLANAKQISAGLEEIAKATAFDADQEGLAENTKKLHEMMLQLQARVQAIMDEMRQHPNASLTSEGRQMRAQADRGFIPAKEWAESHEAAKVRAAGREAYALTVWRRVGLAPEAEDGLSKAEALLEGLAQVIRVQPTSPTKIASEWERVAAKVPGLANLDQEVVVEWLERRLLPQTADPEVSTLPTRDYAVFHVALNANKQGEEDLVDWVVSRSGYRLKAQIAIACLSIMLAIFFTVRNGISLSVRDKAWQQMRLAAAANDDSGIIRAGEQYFSTSSPLGEEKGRSEAVVAIYSSAMIRWFAAHSHDSASDATARVERFRRLVANKGYLNQPGTGGVQ